MKNLLLQSVHNVDVDLGASDADEDDPICFFCMDSVEGLLYAATRNAVVLCLADSGQKVSCRCAGILKQLLVTNLNVPDHLYCLLPCRPSILQKLLQHPLCISSKRDLANSILHWHAGRQQLCSWIF